MSTSTFFEITTANGQLNEGSGGSGSGSSFFDNSGAVGGVFAVVGLVCAGLIAGVVYMLYKRRKAQKMDADVVAAASAAAATTRTPFDDDDPEMIEQPGYGTTGAAGASGAYGANNAMMQQYYNNYAPSTNEYEPSHFSVGTGPGYAGMGAYGPGAGAAAAGAAAYYGAGAGAGTDGSHYYESVPGHQADPAAAYYGVGSAGHENGYSQHTHEESPYVTAAPAASGAPQLNWSPAHADGMRDDALLGPNVFADPASGSSNETDGRLDMRVHEAGSAVSLRDDQDYGRKLAVRNNSDE